MRKVILYGELAEKFGKEFNMNVQTVQQAIKLLSANFKNFRQHLIDSNTRLAGYEVWDGDYDLEGNQVEFQKIGTGDIRIVPVISGAGATGRIIAGVILVIIGAIGLTVGQAYGGATWGSMALSMGIGLIAGGIAEKLAGKPKDVDASEVENTKSYIFSGAVNTTRQGVPVQIGYGKMLIGSAVISASITTVDIPI